MKRMDKHKKDKYRWLKRIGLTIAFFLAVAIPVSATYMYTITKNSVDNMYKPSKVATQNKMETLKAENLDTKISVLIMGLDNDDIRDIGSTRADGLIYLVYDGANKKMEMVSLPRDIYTDIYDGSGNGIVEYKGKINAGYVVAEEDSMIETVQNYLDLPVDYFATVNFISFVQIIDAIGGIDLDVPYDIRENFEKDNTGEIIVPQGKQHLNGEQALAFSRIRKVDDDVLRGERQQQVIEQTINQILTINSIPKYKQILDTASTNINTNFTFENLTSLAGNMLNGFEINSNTYSWESGWVGEESIVVVHDDSYNEIRNKMIEALGYPSDYSFNY